jgi:Cu/Ag efflux protein CusF
MRGSQRGSWRRWFAAATAALVLPLVAGAGCRKDERESMPSAGAKRYTVRGEVVRLADPATPGGEVMIRHEAIDDFVDRDGKVVGMAPMVMPFAVEPSLARGLAVGDKVEIRFAVDWSGPTFQVEHVGKLPAATQLRFVAEEPPGSGARQGP